MKRALLFLSLLSLSFLAKAQHQKPLFNTQANFPHGGWYGDIMATNLIKGDLNEEFLGLSEVKGKTGFGIGVGRFNYFIGGIVVDYMSYGVKYAQYSAKGFFSEDLELNWTSRKARVEVDLGKMIVPANYTMILPYVRLQAGYGINQPDSLATSLLHNDLEKGSVDLRAAIGLAFGYKFNSEWFIMPYAHYYFFVDQSTLLNDYDRIAEHWTPWEVGLKFLWHKPKSDVVCSIPKDKVNLNKTKRKRKGPKLF